MEKRVWELFYLYWFFMYDMWIMNNRWFMNFYCMQLVCTPFPSELYLIDFCFWILYVYVSMNQWRMYNGSIITRFLLTVFFFILLQMLPLPWMNVCGCLLAWGWLGLILFYLERYVCRNVIDDVQSSSETVLFYFVGCMLWDREIDGIDWMLNKDGAHAEGSGRWWAHREKLMVLLASWKNLYFFPSFYFLYFVELMLSNTRIFRICVWNVMLIIMKFK